MDGRFASEEKEKDHANVSIRDTLDQFIKDEENVSIQPNDTPGQNRAEVERKLVRKLDIWLLPTAIVIFILNYIDVSSSTGIRFLRRPTLGTA